MRDELKQLLKNSLAEQYGSNDAVIIDSVKILANLLLSSVGLFELVPKQISGWEHDGLEFMPFPGFERPMDDAGLALEFHPQHAILLHDGLHASAHGRATFMYRAKGDRLYFFENGDLTPVNIYGTVSRQGFFLRKDPLVDFGINALTPSSDPEWIRLLFGYVLSDPNQQEIRFIGQDLITLLCNIKKPFRREFLLEHLLIPPDVDTISPFSMSIREMLWDICLSREFEAEVGRSDQNRCMNILSAAAISPAPQQIVSFVRQLSLDKTGLQEVLDRLDQLDANLSGKIEKVGTELQSQEFWQRLFAQMVLVDAGKEVVRHEPPAKLEDLEALVLLIVDQFKQLVEHNGLWKELWNGNKPRPEATAQQLFFLMAHSYCKANNIDLTPEADLGNGPVDFKMSQGFRCKVVVEIKLSTNSSLVHGYEKQLEVYKTADETDIGIFLVIDVGELGGKLDKVNELRKNALLEKGRASHIRSVDGHRKLSASKR